MKMIRNRLGFSFADPEITRAAGAMATDEVERCALLAEALATVHERKAVELRTHTYSTRSLWPPFKRYDIVMPGYEREAKLRDQAASSLRTVAECMRRGYDPRDLEPDETQKIDPDTEAKLKAMRC